VGLHQRLRAPRSGRLYGLLLTVPLLLLGACSSQERDEWGRLAMPEGASDRSGYIQHLWNGAWLAAMLVGVLVWGLIFYCVIRFRRRSDDEIPVQIRYHLPLEILYTIAPVVMVLVFFNFTVTTQNDVLNEQDPDPDHTINVVGQQWSWTFNYVEDDAIDGQSVYTAGTPAERPTLYLPVDQTIEFELTSPDVIHSFWVPAFTFKMDVIPGRTNTFQMTPTREGTFDGRCAELCGTYHSRMLFTVKVVSAEEYADQLAALEEAGNVGTAEGGEDADTQAGLEEQVQGDDTTQTDEQSDDTGGTE
jgi:cytochrome c oxidase subunit 2